MSRIDHLRSPGLNIRLRRRWRALVSPIVKQAVLAAAAAMAVLSWGGGPPLEAAWRMLAFGAVASDSPQALIAQARRLPAPAQADAPPDAAVPQRPAILRTFPAGSAPERTSPAQGRPIPIGTGRAASVESLFNYSLGRFLRW